MAENIYGNINYKAYSSFYDIFHAYISISAL